jgi:hypothetical protein
MVAIVFVPQNVLDKANALALKINIS